MALISDSHDKEITIKRLTEENAKLTEENVILKAKMTETNPQPTDKSGNNKRILPSTPPLPNIPKLFEDMQTKMTK